MRSPCSEGYGYERQSILNQIPFPLRARECYVFLRSLCRAPLLAQVGFFAILGIAAGYCVFGRARLGVSNRWRPQNAIGLIVLGLLVYVFAAWSAKSYGDCHDPRYGGEINGNDYAYSSNLRV